MRLSLIVALVATASLAVLSGSEQSAQAATVNVVAVGDIACAPGSATTATTCQQAATAARARALAPQVVLVLGDAQYPSGSYADFLGSYAKSWGTMRSISRAVPGNHEYQTSGAAGYARYFGSRISRSPYYHRLAVGSWQIYMLNSNCDKIDCGAEVRWLDAQMAAHPSKCSAIVMHHPRFSSGSEHGSNAQMTAFWNTATKYRTDLVLAGHDHDYERFAPLNGRGELAAAGPTSFVVGTGGKSLRPIGTRVLGSAYFQAKAPGVLQLQLGSTSFAWRFATAGGTFPDSGSRTCI